MEVHFTPDHEAFILERIQDGRFSSADEAVREAVSLLKAKEIRVKGQSGETGQRLIDAFAMVKDLLHDVDFSRDRTEATWRPVDLP